MVKSFFVVIDKNKDNNHYLILFKDKFILSPESIPEEIFILEDNKLEKKF